MESFREKNKCNAGGERYYKNYQSLLLDRTASLEENV